MLSLSTPLTGTLNVTGSLAAGAKGAIGDALGSLLGGNVAKQIGSVNIKSLNANADIKGNVVITSRPKLTPNWHIEPGLAAQVALGDTAFSVAGAKVNVPAQVKPLIDKAVNDQIAAVQARIRNDPSLEQNARQQWAKICRSIPLQGARLDAAGAVAGIEADPRGGGAAARRCHRGDPDHGHRGRDPHHIVGRPNRTARSRRPSRSCRPAPAAHHRRADRHAVHRTQQDLEAQFAGKTFPEDGSGSLDVTVKHASVAASGDRLLISLLVNAKEKKSFFGFGGEATVHIWGRPLLDQAQQTLRLTDIQLAVESEAAFGLLGTAARAAMPYLQKQLADKAAIDLKPFAANAQKRSAP